MNTTTTSSSEKTIRDYYRHADNGDAEAALALFTDDVEIRFGNNPAATGTGVLMAAAEMLGSVCTSMLHTVTGVFTDSTGRHGACELAMTYVRRDGPVYEVPAAGLFEFSTDGHITKYHVFVDLSGLAQ